MNEILKDNEIPDNSSKDGEISKDLVRDLSKDLSKDLIRDLSKESLDNKSSDNRSSNNKDSNVILPRGGVKALIPPPFSQSQTHSSVTNVIRPISSPNTLRRKQHLNNVTIPPNLANVANDMNKSNLYHEENNSRILPPITSPNLIAPNVLPPAFSVVNRPIHNQITPVNPISPILSAPLIKKEDIVPIMERPEPPKDTTPISLHGVPLNRENINPIQQVHSEANVETINTEEIVDNLLETKIQEVQIIDNLPESKIQEVQIPEIKIPEIKILESQINDNDSDQIVRPSSPILHVSLPEISIPVRNNRQLAFNGNLVNGNLVNGNFVNDTIFNPANISKPATSLPPLPPTPHVTPSTPSVPSVPSVNQNYPSVNQNTQSYPSVNQNYPSVNQNTQSSSSVSYFLPPLTQSSPSVNQNTQNTQGSPSINQNTQGSPSINQNTQNYSPVTQHNINPWDVTPVPDYKPQAPTILLPNTPWSNTPLPNAPWSNASLSNTSLPNASLPNTSLPTGAATAATGNNESLLPSIPDYSSMSPELQAQYRAIFRIRFGTLRGSYPSYFIPDFPDTTPLSQIHVQYDVYLRNVYANQDADQYECYLVLMWLIMELFLSKLGLNIIGYTEAQMKSMHKYKKLLLELGENNHRYTGNVIASPWPAELRIVFVALLNAVIFILIKMFANMMGETMAANMVESVINFMTRDNTRPAEQPGQAYQNNQPGQAYQNGQPGQAYQNGQPDQGPNNNAPRGVPPIPPGGNPFGNINIASLLGQLGSAFMTGTQTPPAANNANANANATNVSQNHRPAYDE